MPPTFTVTDRVTGASVASRILLPCDGNSHVATLWAMKVTRLHPAQSSCSSNSLLPGLTCYGCIERYREASRFPTRERTWRLSADCNGSSKKVRPFPWVISSDLKVAAFFFFLLILRVVPADIGSDRDGPAATRESPRVAACVLAP